MQKCVYSGCNFTASVTVHLTVTRQKLSHSAGIANIIVFAICCVQLLSITFLCRLPLLPNLYGKKNDNTFESLHMKLTLFPPCQQEVPSQV